MQFIDKFKEVKELTRQTQPQNLNGTAEIPPTAIPSPLNSPRPGAVRDSPRFPIPDSPRDSPSPSVNQVRALADNLN